MKIVLLVFLICVVVASPAVAGNGVKGGILVYVQGQWVPFEEAMSASSGIYQGTNNLPTGGATDPEGPFRKDYRLSLEKWLERFDRLSPNQAKAMRVEGLAVRFVYVDEFLAFVPKELPSSDIDFGAYRKAAIYRGATDNQTPTIYVSIPAMESMGTLGDKRLSVKENQGFVLFHELINATYPYLRANPIAEFGRLVIDAYLKNWSPLEFGLQMTENGSYYFSDPHVTVAEKVAVLKLLDQMGILYKIKLDGQFTIAERLFESLVIYDAVASDPSNAKKYIPSEKQLKDILVNVRGRTDFGLSLNWSSVLPESTVLSLVDELVTDLPAFYVEVCGGEKKSDYCREPSSHFAKELASRIREKINLSLGSRFQFHNYENMYGDMFYLNAISSSGAWYPVGVRKNKAAPPVHGYCLYVGSSPNLVPGLPSLSILEYIIFEPYKMQGNEVDRQTLARKQHFDSLQSIMLDTGTDHKSLGLNDTFGYGASPFQINHRTSFPYSFKITPSCIPLDVVGAP